MVAECLFDVVHADRLVVENDNDGYSASDNGEPSENESPSSASTSTIGTDSRSLSKSFGSILSLITFILLLCLMVLLAEKVLVRCSQLFLRWKVDATVKRCSSNASLYSLGSVSYLLWFLF